MLWRYITDNRNPVAQSVNALREGLHLVYRRRGLVTVYGFSTEIISGFILAPMLFLMLDKLLEWSGIPVAVNYDIGDQLVSPVGVMMALAWSAVVCVLALLTNGGFVIIAASAREGRRVPVTMIWRTVTATISRIRSLGIVALMAWLTILLPLGITLLGFAWTLLFDGADDLLVHFWAELTRWQKNLLLIMVPLSLVLGLFLQIRWSMIIHVLLLEECTLNRAIRRSSAITREHWKTVALTITGQQLLASLLVVLVTTALGEAGSALASALSGISSLAGQVALGIAVALKLIVLSLTAFLVVAWWQSSITLLYLSYTDADTNRLLDRISDTRVDHSGRVPAAAIIGIALLASGLSIPILIEELSDYTDSIEITAHRGDSSRAPENTLAAVNKAIEAGADFAEIDVQQISDGTLIVFHDFSLRRIAGLEKSTQDLIAEDLPAVDAGSWFSPEFSTEKIPTLTQIITTARGNIQLNIELKLHGAEQSLAESIVDVMSSAGIAPFSVVSSLDTGILAEIRKINPAIQVGAIVSAKFGALENLDVDFYSVPMKMATRDFIRRAHRIGREVHVWTVNTPEELNRMMDAGVDNIITDYPAQAVAISNERSGMDKLSAIIRRLLLD